MTNLEQQNVENPVDVSVENPEAVDLSDTMALLDANAESDADFSGLTGGILDKIMAMKKEPKNPESGNDRLSDAVSRAGSEAINALNGAINTFKTFASSLEKEFTVYNLEHALKSLKDFSGILSDTVIMSQEFNVQLDFGLLGLANSMPGYIENLDSAYNQLKNPNSLINVDQKRTRDLLKETMALMEKFSSPVLMTYSSLLELKVKKLETQVTQQNRKIGAAERAASDAKRKAAEANQRAAEPQQNPGAPEQNNKAPQQGNGNGVRVGAFGGAFGGMGM